MSTIVLNGPRNAGKRCTAQLALNCCDKTKENRNIHIIWIRANHIRTDVQLAEALEDAFDLVWEQPSPMWRLLHALTPALVTSGPSKDISKRISSAIDQLEERAKKDMHIIKYVVLLDGFDSTKPGRALTNRNSLMRQLAAAFTRLAQNNTVQSVVVSNNTHFTDYFQGDPTTKAMVEWLSPEEAISYVRKVLPDATEYTAQTILLETGRLVGHLHNVCNKAKAAPPAQLLQTVKEAVDTLVYHERDRIVRIIGKSRHKKEIKVAITFWNKLQPGKTGQIVLGLKPQSKLDKSLRVGLECLLTMGVIYRDCSGSLKETSLVTRKAIANIASLK